MKKKLKDSLQCYLMLLPTMTGASMFVIFPILWVFRYCLFRYTGFGNLTYVGFDNFIRAFARDARFWESVLNSFIFALGKLMFEVPLAIVLAYFLSRKFRGSSFYRTIIYLPAMLSIAVVGLQFSYLFGAYGGVVNEGLKVLGFETFFGKEVPISWFSSKMSAMCILMIASIWQYVGVNMLFFMSGMQSIPEEIYEAANIDGANSCQKLFKITLPMLGPIGQMVILNTILGSLKVTDLVLVLTNGQPSGKTEVMMSYIFKTFFGGTLSSASNYGYGATLVVLATVILGIVAIIYLKMTRKISVLY